MLTRGFKNWDSGFENFIPFCNSLFPVLAKKIPVFFYDKYIIRMIFVLNLIKILNSLHPNNDVIDKFYFYLANLLHPFHVIILLRQLFPQIRPYT